MLPALMQGLERLCGAPLNRVALNFHILALAVLALFWFGPLAAAMFRKWRQTKPAVWVRFWLCPVCGQLNRRTFVKCTRCERVRPVRLWDRWETSSLAQGLARLSQRLAGFWRVLGWLLLYGVPAAAFGLFRLYSFHQNPLREILGSTALLLLLLALFFFRAALRSGWRSPIDALVDVLAGSAAAGLFLTAGFLWAAAPFPPGKAMAIVQLNPDGRIQWSDSVGRRTTIAGGALPNQVQFHVRYAVFAWPLVGAEQIFLTHVEGQPVTESWTLGLIKRGASNMKADDPRRPRVVLLEQLLSAVPGHTYELYVPASKIGLALRPARAGG